VHFVLCRAVRPGHRAYATSHNVSSKQQQTKNRASPQADDDEYEYLPGGRVAALGQGKEVAAATEADGEAEAEDDEDAPVCGYIGDLADDQKQDIGTSTRHVSSAGSSALPGQGSMDQLD
jgi:hypothetical protein